MLGLINRGKLPSFVQEEFENLVARLREIFLKEHNEDGTHITSVAAVNYVPVGAILAWGTDTAPTGWVLCRGQQVSRLTYKGLFDVITTTYGVGDGTTTYNVPDLQQRFPMGKASAGTGNALAGTGGTIDHVHAFSGGTSSSDGAHTHTVDPPNTTSGTESAQAAANTDLTGGIFATFPAGSHTHDTDIGSFGSSSDGAHTHTFGAGTTDADNPPYLVVNYIIFTGVM